MHLTIIVCTVSAQPRDSSLTLHTNIRKPREREHYLESERDRKKESEREREREKESENERG